MGLHPPGQCTKDWHWRQRRQREPRTQPRIHGSSNHPGSSDSTCRQGHGWRFTFWASLRLLAMWSRQRPAVGQRKSMWHRQEHRKHGVLRHWPSRHFELSQLLQDWMRLCSKLTRGQRFAIPRALGVWSSLDYTGRYFWCPEGPSLHSFAVHLYKTFGIWDSRHLHAVCWTCSRWVSALCQCHGHDGYLLEVFILLARLQIKTLCVEHLIDDGSDVDIQAMSEYQCGDPQDLIPLLLIRYFS